MKKQILLLFAALMLSLGATAQMVLQFNTNLSDGKTITLPLYGTVDVTVNWGDGSSDTYTEAGNQDHTYAAEGTYTVSISGSLTHFGYDNAGSIPNIDKLVRVTSFGNIGLTSLSNAFYGAVNLIELPPQLPSTVGSLESMLRQASDFNFNIGGWDVSNVYTMFGLFNGATSFNQDIGSWDVSRVGDMGYLFNRATAFNQDIGSWNVSKVYNMFSLFSEAKSFNQDIGSWDVSKATMMGYMFRGATAFNQDIGSWNVSKVNNMYCMFSGAKSFNQDISSWNVSGVYEMHAMFERASSFNQDISSWNVSRVINMTEMFSNAIAFNQDIGSWDVGNVTKMTDMFKDVTLSTNNYNNILIGWAGQTVNNDINFNGGNSKYSPGEAADARAVLTGTYGWTIIDGGESIVPVVDVDLTISNTTVAGSESTCFNALNEITIAGDGKNVVFESASNVTIIAGQSILFLPGFHAKEGSYTHAYITTDASFCDALPMPLMAAEPDENKSVELKYLDPNEDKDLQAQASLKVYPNPNKGQFTVRLENMESQVNVLIFNAVGTIVHQQKTSNEILNIDLSNTQPGIYFVRAFNEKEQITQKLIVK